LRVQVLPGLPGREDTVSLGAEWGGVFKCKKPWQRSGKLVAKAATEKAVGQNRIVGYLRDTWFELRKVSWPTRSEAINLTVIVVSVTTFLSIVLGLMDYLFSTVFGLII
jgi:preprotein translocase SecE subunit